MLSLPDELVKMQRYGSVPLTGRSGKFEADFSVVVLRLPLPRLLHLPLFTAQPVGLHPEGIVRGGEDTGLDTRDWTDLTWADFNISSLDFLCSSLEEASSSLQR